MIFIQTVFIRAESPAMFGPGTPHDFGAPEALPAASKERVSQLLDSGRLFRYQGVDELMPFAQGVSAKSHAFNALGSERHTDYDRMLDIVVKKHGWRGHIGVEFEGGGSEDVGIKKTKALLERVRGRIEADMQAKQRKAGK